MKTRAVSMTLALALLAACEANPLGGSDSPQFVASVEGSVRAEYEGTGQFRTAPAGLPRPLKFSLWSIGRGTASNQAFEFNSQEMPGVGAYPLGRSGRMGGEQIYAAYSRQDGGKVEQFSAQTGELIIIESSPTRIAGTFKFEGVLTSVCTAAHSSVQSCTILSPDASAQQVAVAGSFQAVPGRHRR